MLTECIRQHVRDRIESGHSMRSVARDIDIEPSHLRRFLIGKAGVSTENLDRLASAVGATGVTLQFPSSASA